MKKLVTTLLSIVLVLFTQAQTAEEVIQKYSANLGGLDAFNKIKTAKLTGTFSTQGNDLPLKIDIINNKGARTEVEVMGTQILNVYFDGKGWKQNALAGAPSPTELTTAEIVDIRPQSMLAPVLMDYKSRGHQAELAGKEDVEGKSTFKIKLTSKDDAKVTYYYINASDYSLIKSETDRELQGQTMTVESWYSDIKEINGIKFYMKRTNKVDGQELQAIKFDTIELDVPVDEKTFAMP
jgi:hypothetical protein